MARYRAAVAILRDDVEFSVVVFRVEDNGHIIEQVRRQIVLDASAEGSDDLAAWVRRARETGMLPEVARVCLSPKGVSWEEALADIRKRAADF